MASRLSALRISTFLTSGALRVSKLGINAHLAPPTNARLSKLGINIHSAPPTTSMLSKLGINVHAAPPTSEIVSKIEIDAWVSLDQAFYALGLFGSNEVFAPDFDVEPIFESPEPPEIEVNPYRAAEANTDLQQILREQHNVTQAGDSTFHWGVLTEIYAEPLYNLGAHGRFYHDTLGIIEARYCRFIDFQLTDAKAVPVGLRKPANSPWTVTNRFDLSAANAVLGIALPYDPKIYSGIWYGWVITEGFVPAEVNVALSPKAYPFGTEYAWSATGVVEQELDSNSVGYRVKIGGTPWLTSGAFYVNVDSSSLGRANGLITARLAPLVSDINGIETRLDTLEATVAGHTVEIGAINQRHDDFVTFMTNEVKNLSDALAAVRALMPDSNFKEYVDTSIANLTGYVDTGLSLVGTTANNALARANEAYALAQSISYDGIQVQINALNNAMGGITNRIIGFKTTIDTNTLTAGQTLVSYLYNTDVDGVNYYDFRPVDFKFANLTDVDVSTPPTNGQVPIWDAGSNKWIPGDVTGGGGGGGVVGFDSLFAWDGAVNPTFTAKDLNVTDYDEFLIIMKDVTLAASNWRTLSMSSDGGATWDNTANNYWAISSTGTQAVGGDTHLYMHATSASAARSIVTHLHNLSKAAPTMYENTRENNYGLYRPEVVVNAIRIGTVSGTAAYNGGKIWAYGRKSVAGATRPWYWAPPTAASFTAATGAAHGLSSLTDNTDEGLLFDFGAPVSGDDSIWAYQTIATPAVDWTCTMRFQALIPSTNFSAVGLMCQYSVNSRILTNYLSNDHGVKLLNVNPSSYVGEIFMGLSAGTEVNWLQLKKVGGTIQALLSPDGKTWSMWASQPIATWLTADPDRIGFGVLYNRGTGPNVIGSIQHWSFQ